MRKEFSPKYLEAIKYPTEDCLGWHPTLVPGIFLESCAQRCDTFSQVQHMRWCCDGCSNFKLQMDAMTWRLEGDEIKHLAEAVLMLLLRREMLYYDNIVRDLWWWFVIVTANGKRFCGEDILCCVLGLTARYLWGKGSYKLCEKCTVLADNTKLRSD